MSTLRNPSAATTAYITHPIFRAHAMAPGHPECPQRLESIEQALRNEKLFDLLQHREAIAATREQLERVHTQAHCDRLVALSPTRGLVPIDPDTAMNAYTLEAATHAAGAAVLAVDLVLGGEARSAFCAVRPPGHHAERSRAMGFCFFDNVAVGAAHALAAHGLERVAILDFDVHHGNGTEDIFRDEPRVLFCSAHQHPNYPGTGLRSVPHHIVNLPLPPGTGDGDYRRALEAGWFPEIESFEPELLLVSAGFDAHASDPLAALQLQVDDYRWITEQIVALAERFTEGRIVSCLEGGYDLAALGQSAAAHLRALMRL